MEYEPIYVLISERGNVVDYKYDRSLNFCMNQWIRDWQTWMEQTDEEFFILKATIDPEPLRQIKKDTWCLLREENNDD